MLSASRSSPIVRPRRLWAARPGRRDGSKGSLPDELGAGGAGSLGGFTVTAFADRGHDGRRWW